MKFNHPQKMQKWMRNLGKRRLDLLLESKKHFVFFLDIDSSNKTSFLHYKEFPTLVDFNVFISNWDRSFPIFGICVDDKKRAFSYLITDHLYVKVGFKRIEGELDATALLYQDLYDEPGSEIFDFIKTWDSIFGGIEAELIEGTKDLAS